MDFGTRLKKLRLERGMSQRELATLVGCSHQTIADCEKNRNDGRIQILKKLCFIFDVSADYFINGISSNYPEEISLKEIQMILKYRSSSDYYKSIVDTILDSSGRQHEQ